MKESVIIWDFSRGEMERRTRITARVRISQDAFIDDMAASADDYISECVKMKAAVRMKLAEKAYEEFKDEFDEMGLRFRPGGGE